MALAAAVELKDGEQVSGLVVGEYLGHAGVAVVTPDRVLLINSRQYAPDIDSLARADIDEVKGWIEGNRATLRISGGGQGLVIGNIRELDTVQAVAAQLRGEVP